MAIGQMNEQSANVFRSYLICPLVSPRTHHLHRRTWLILKLTERRSYLDNYLLYPPRWDYCEGNEFIMANHFEVAVQREKKSKVGSDTRSGSDRPFLSSNRLRLHAWGCGVMADE